ncbi:MAG TPA: hypothetical protein VIM12_01890 [Noviherbaspirillum sp.]|jgi:DnaJ-class molecular chaperone|uniref:hypothetical protein n=1 Tax=Noviherbaspirillum sp. TaxID=1926288 RepID=UPI002F9284AB
MSTTNSNAPTPAARNPGDEATPGTEQTAENTCPVCAGSGRDAKQAACPNCGGTGVVIVTVGDA